MLANSKQMKVAMARDSSRNADKIDRRNFIQLSATGVAVSLTSSVGLAAPAAADARASDGSVGTAARAEARSQQAGPDPALLDGRPDPTSVAAETWLEPWIWRPADWPEAQLDLNVVEHQNPGPSPSPGNPFPALFSFGGISPGPTIRMRGDQTLRIRLRNLLSQNRGMKPVGPFPDPVDITPENRKRVCRLVAGMDPDAIEDPPPCVVFFATEQLQQLLPGRWIPAHLLNEHTNGLHQAHVTNLHTHGLHVEPERNPNGTHSDDVLLRLIPRADWVARQQAEDPARRTLAPFEQVGEIDIEISPGDVWRRRRPPGEAPWPHPPGTHWYHPHPHGATNDQVASGMAGFLIVEGDVDDAINRAMTGQERPDVQVKTGPFDYRERLIFLQRVLLQALDFDAGPGRRQLTQPPDQAVNGTAPPAVTIMRPGAVERWRVLNGSVDGKGSKRFMVLEGEYVESPGQLWRVTRPAPDAPGPPEGGSGGAAGGDQDAEPPGVPPAPPAPTLEPVTLQEIEDAKQQIYQLAFDGITLVTEEDGEPKYTIDDLSLVNSGTHSPLSQPVPDGPGRYQGLLRNLEDCYRDGDSLRLAFNRPNEVRLGNANRADLFFRAPLGSAGKVYTIFAQEDFLHQDNTQQGLQVGTARVQAGTIDDQSLPELFRGLAPLDVVVGYIHVRGEPVEGGDFDVLSLRDVLPTVPAYLTAVQDEELRIPDGEASATGARPGTFRTRTLAYSGWGSADFPSVPVPASFADAHPHLKGLVWDEVDGVAVLLPPDIRTMGIHGNFDLARSPEPGPAQKFSMNDPTRPVMLAETAEEWVVYNTSMPLWGHTDKQRFPQPGSYALHLRSYPLTRAEGQRRFWEDHEFQITAKGNDHPFHIHINPCWVTRIDVPDEAGRLHNILPKPCWMDTVQVPRSGGRVVFRSRFPDYTGRWIHHCHILAHEDNGMMQVIETTEDPARVTYSPRQRVASHAAAGETVDALYPPPSLDLCYRTNLSFEDRTPTGQVFPGFPVTTPQLDD